ncbi:MAG: tripartite tricarboxylate transporter TctB family protein [Thermodesulfobacteriota bacterium]
MKTIRQADIGVGCFLAALGLFILYAASNIRIGVERALSPRFFPSVLGIVIFLCGAGLAFKSWRFRGEDPGIHWPDRRGAVIVAVNLVLLAAYILLMKPLGLPISTFLYVTATTWFLKPEKWGVAVLAGVSLGVISYVVFIQLLELSFPVGSLLERILEG